MWRVHRQSVRTQLVLVLVAVAAVPAAAVGALAYESQRALVVKNATNTVQMAAAGRKATLLYHLSRNRARNANLVASAALACEAAPDRAACLQAHATAFLEAEGAIAVVFYVPGLAPTAAGAPRGPMDAPLRVGQLALFRGGGGPSPSYLTDAVGEDGSRLVVERRCGVLDAAFADHVGLGDSGETFLTDQNGLFLTQARYPSHSGHSHPIEAQPMRRCLAGESASMVAGDYRPVVVVHAFEALPEIGGGCIMAHIDYAEAMQPLAALRNRALALALAFVAAASALAYVLGWLLVKPLEALVSYAGSIERGNFDAPPVSPGGGRELKRLADALASMARGLASTLLLGAERAARHEAERAERRMRLLADASELLVGSLDPPSVLGRVISLAITALGDCEGVVYLHDGDAKEWRVIVPEGNAPPPTSLLGHPPLLPARGNALVAPIALAARELGVLVLWRSPTRAGFDGSDDEVARELAHRIALALENARLYREAREAVTLRDSFISVASHELRTPLTSLRLRLEHLARLRASVPEKVGASLVVIERQVGRLTDLIESMLDISRISTTRIRLDAEETDMAAVVTEACGRFRDALTAAASLLELHAGESVIGRWDPFRLDQIATNLVANAIKYGAGGVIEVRVEADGDDAVLRVSDHGIGIAETNRQRIFERFGRAVSERNYPGLGLGLWIVQEIVAAMGGSIHVDSELGRGSTFTVRVPRGSAAAVAHALH